MKKILVIGSSNTDLITKVNQFPSGGETIEAVSSFQAMGGKGANQAMAAHRLGGDVNFITCLGDDSYGQTTLEYFENEGLNVADSLIVKGANSGTAMILVDSNGENLIVITPGANNLLTPDHVRHVSEAFEEADYILLQMEIPYETILSVCETAYQRKKKVILNVAPARSLDAHLLGLVDILVVNETEAETITKENISTKGLDAIVDQLLGLGVQTVILTLGESGCILKNASETITIPAFKVEVKDTTGAGDTFCGALAVGLSKKQGWKKALNFATAAAALCVTKMGAQPSIPKEEEVVRFLKIINQISTGADEKLSTR